MWNVVYYQSLTSIFTEAVDKGASHLILASLTLSWFCAKGLAVHAQSVDKDKR